MRRRTVGLDLVRGALAGALATWVMGRVTTYLYEHENPAVRKREDQARNDKIAYGVTAEKAAERLGFELSEEEQGRYGTAIHWAPGAAFWLIIDEAANPILGLTPGPQAFPWQTHARGFTGHLVFGAVTDAALGGMEVIEHG